MTQGQQHSQERSCLARRLAKVTVHMAPEKTRAPKRLLLCGLCSSVCYVVLLLGDFERKTSCLLGFAKCAMLCGEGGRGALCLSLLQHLSNFLHGSRELEGDLELMGRAGTRVIDAGLPKCTKPQVRSRVPP